MINFGQISHAIIFCKISDEYILLITSSVSNFWEMFHQKSFIQVM